jgi:hypothetical protein
LTPLIAGWSIWLGIAISSQSNDIRVAQQLGILASLPSVIVTSLIAFNVVHPPPVLVLGLIATLVPLDAFAWRMVSLLFNRERHITNTR